MQNSNHPEPTHIERGDYIADVLQGSTAYRFWYYIIQRKGSKEIIDLVKFDSYEQAIASAQALLAKLNRAATTK